MNTQNESNTQTDLARVLDKITEIAEKSSDGDYIYRGEPECHEKVSSNLYREYEDDIEAEKFDVTVVQEEILIEAREYTTHKMDDTEILTELQHYGGKTNLIDFTTDYLVALFFACDGNPDKPGRVILLKNQHDNDNDNYKVVRAPRTIPRVGVQKSIFVQARSGVVDPDIVVCIPADLKDHMLEYLRKHHDISAKTIYNDLLGFIEKRRIHKSGYTEFYKGLTCQKRVDSVKNPVEKQKWYDKAIEHYTEAVNLNSQDTVAYANRGAAYGETGEFDKAIQDFNTAIELNPEYVPAYNNRGLAYADKGEFNKAIQDYNKAIALNPEYDEAYANRGVAYRKTGKFNKAIQDFNTAIELNPQDTLSYYNRGATYGTISKTDRAIQDFNTAIELNPEDALAYYGRGIAYERRREFDKTIQDYDTAIELNPEYTETYHSRGMLLLRLREWEEAKVDLNTAKELGINIVASFHNAYKSVETFEAKYKVKVPEDIAALLSRNGN